LQGQAGARMAFGFANALSETLPWHRPTVRPRSAGAKTGLTGQRIAATSRLAGGFNGRNAGLRMSFARKASYPQVLWGRVEIESGIVPAKSDFYSDILELR